MHWLVEDTWSLGAMAQGRVQINMGLVLLFHKTHHLHENSAYQSLLQKGIVLPAQYESPP